MNEELNKNEIEQYFIQLQDTICKGLETADGKGLFKEEQWQRAEGGGGRTRVITDGAVIEKGGVNFSAVWGACPEFLKKETGIPATERAGFFASGVSIVIHPKNPHVPIIHMNVRYFEAVADDVSTGKSRLFQSWFGGGIDLTPHYINQEDAIWFHATLKKICDKHSTSYYSEFSKWADEYFYLPHRSETRGIGGIFFDKLTAGKDKTMQQYFEFVKEVGGSFLTLYLPIIEKNRNKEYTDTERRWQLLRRGRYVEFNLVYDRGTKFGLLTNGRTESILISLPPYACWDYNVTPETDGEEEKTLKLLRKGINWAYINP